MHWEIDFAFWCSYKYMNGGPGATGGLYLNREAFRACAGSGRMVRLAQRSAVSDEPGPCSGRRGRRAADRYPEYSQYGAAARSAATDFRKPRSQRIRTKSLQLTAFLRDRIERLSAEIGFDIATPRADAQRGGHIALVHREAVRICKALSRPGSCRTIGIQTLFAGRRSRSIPRSWTARRPLRAWTISCRHAHTKPFLPNPVWSPDKATSSKFAQCSF